LEDVIENVCWDWDKDAAERLTAVDDERRFMVEFRSISESCRLIQGLDFIHSTEDVAVKPGEEFLLGLVENFVIHRLGIITAEDFLGSLKVIKIQLVVGSVKRETKTGISKY